jgi:hypothetical protein
MLAALPVAGLAGYDLTAAGQFAPARPVAPAAPVAPVAPVAPAESQATAEMRIELKKAQIQAALSEKIAQVKEEALKALQASPAGVDLLLSAQLDVVMARAGADVAKLNMESVDTQLRSGQIGPQNPNQPPTPTTIQLLGLEVKKAHIQTVAAVKVVDIRQKQYEREMAQLKDGKSTAEKVSDAMLDVEAAKATAEIAQLDERLMDSRVSAATGGGRR